MAPTSPGDPATAPRVALAGVRKAFVPGRPVLAGVDLDIAEGEIHALLGENGAGKSTLMNVLIGLVRPDEGGLRVDGEPRPFEDFGPAQAARDGIAMVHQHSTLVEAMNVEENVGFGDSRGGPRFDPGRTAARLAASAERFGMSVPLGVPVADLSVGQRQRAEILRALDRGARVLILDEPTAALTPQETDELFPALVRLRDEGCSIIFISHKLDEVKALADRVSVLRRGVCVSTARASAHDAASLGELMLGRQVEPPSRPARPETGAPGPRLALRDVTAPGLRESSALKSLEVEVGAGEIVGIAGIDGNGQRELEEVLVGVRALTRGRIEVDGRIVPPGVRGLRAVGAAHLSGDRERAGLLGGFALWENWILKSSRDGAPYFPGGRLDARRARADVGRAIERFQITPPLPDVDIATLSGGNAQKLAVARELDLEPQVLIAVNPTRGLDVGSTQFVHEQLYAVRARGGGVLLISTELDEVLALSDRILVLSEGQLRSLSAQANRREIGAAMLGAVSS